MLRIGGLFCALPFLPGEKYASRFASGPRIFIRLRRPHISTERQIHRLGGPARAYRIHRGRHRKKTGGGAGRRARKGSARNRREHSLRLIRLPLRQRGNLPRLSQQRLLSDHGILRRAYPQYRTLHQFSERARKRPSRSASENTKGYCGQRSDKLYVSGIQRSERRIRLDPSGRLGQGAKRRFETFIRRLQRRRGATPSAKRIDADDGKNAGDRQRDPRRSRHL